jgi:putative membrane protein
MPSQRAHPHLSRGDLLAIERTLLANERTFLAYFRTAVVFLTSGLAILNIDFFAQIKEVSFLLIALSPIILGVGSFRMRAGRRRVVRYYEATERELEALTSNATKP